MLVPYKEEGGQWWGRKQYATEVTRYAEARAERASRCRKKTGKPPSRNGAAAAG
ncbi:MAG: hypothetical protein ACRD7E_22155 [Bryobacteraceae bacterium]